GVIIYKELLVEDMVKCSSLFTRNLHIDLSDSDNLVLSVTNSNLNTQFCSNSSTFSINSSKRLAFNASEELELSAKNTLVKGQLLIS
ncbi:hypothetical protein ACQ7B2_00805, partial [Escherichia coli]